MNGPRGLHRGALAAGVGPLFLLLFGLFWLSTQAAPGPEGAPQGSRAVQPGPDAQIAPAQALGLALTATVGLEPGVCATTTGLRVLPGANLYYCYTATNTGAVTFTTHTLRDTRAGVIWDRKSLILAPGQTIDTVAAQQELGAVADADAATIVTWTAQAGPNQVVTTTKSVLVDVVTPRLALTKTVGLDPATCTATVTRTVLPLADAFYCLTVHNTGDITFTQHSLADPKLGITRNFDYALGPGGQLVLNDAAFDERGGPVDFAARDVTRTVTNTIFYTATTISGYAANGVASVSRAATSTVSLAKAAVAFTKTVGTSSTGCATTDTLNVSDPNSLLYYCVRVHNTGLITLTHHQFYEPKLQPELRGSFTHTLAPGKMITLTNATLLSEFGQSASFGPYTVFYGANQILDNTMYYTGTGPYSSTVTANDHAFAGVNATPTTTATPTPTTQGGSNNDDDNPTDTPTVTFTPSFTPIPPTATPTLTFTPETPTITPTPTRSYAISLLATPTPRFVSPLALPADQAATLAALDTVVAYEATAAAAQLTPTPPPSPLETPTPTVMLSPTLTPTEAMVLIVVTNTPSPEETAAVTPTLPGPNGQRPINLPPPPPTPDTLLLAAEALDGIVLAAGWIWFILGSLVFFTVAGVLVGISFRQQERRRFDLLEPEDLTAPPLPGSPLGPDAPDDDWPASLP